MTHSELPPVYTSTAARRAGMTRTQRQQDGVRVTRGAYVSRSLGLGVHAAAVAALAVLPPGAVVSHRSAAVLLGAPVASSWPLEFSVPPGTYRARRQRLRVCQRSLCDADRTVRHGIPVTSGSQTFLDLASLLPPAELVAVGDALFRARHLDDARLAERLARARGCRGVARARSCGALLTPLAASRPESLLRFWLLEGDVPDPEPQVPLLDRWGREVAHADLGYRREKVAIEYEGRQHAERKRFREDIERYTLMAADGWLVLRFGDVHLDRPAAVVDRVARALRSRGAVW
jgi:Protein of unknown function (DUF559)